MVTNLSRYSLPLQNNSKYADKELATIKALCKYNIPDIFTLTTWEIGKTYGIRMSYCYDLYRFYIINKFNELEIFHQTLCDFYCLNRNRYKIPEEEVTVNMNCVVYYDNSYFRGYITNTLEIGVNKKQYVIYLIDFGYTVVKPAELLYYLHFRFIKVPAFAIRACLIGVKPDNSDYWPLKTMQFFNTVVGEKVVLGCLDSCDTVHKIIYINIGIVAGDKAVDFGQMLISKKLAKPFVITEKDVKLMRAELGIIKFRHRNYDIHKQDTNPFNGVKKLISGNPHYNCFVNMEIGLLPWHLSMKEEMKHFYEFKKEHNAPQLALNITQVSIKKKIIINSTLKQNNLKKYF